MQAEREALVRRLQAGFESGVDSLFDVQRIVGRRPEVQVVPQSAVRSRTRRTGMLPKVSLPIVVIDVAGDTDFMLELGHTGDQAKLLVGTPSRRRPPRCVVPFALNIGIAQEIA